MLYGFQLWFFKGAPTVKNLIELKKIQYRIVLWITGAFHISLSEDVEVIASLIPITFHLRKLNGHHHLRYASILLSYAINSLLDHQHSKNQKPHKYSMANFMNKQQFKLKSPIKDINERLTEIKNEFDPFHSIFYPGLQLVNHFSDRITFHSSKSTNNKDLFIHTSNLNNAFKKSQTAPTDITVITDGSVKANGSAVAVAHIWKDNIVISCLKAQASNVTSIEAELMAIHIGLTLILDNKNVQHIIIITDSLVLGQKIINSGDQPLQKSIILITMKIKSFLEKDGHNSIQF